MAGKGYKTDEALGIIIRIALTWIYTLCHCKKKRIKLLQSHSGLFPAKKQDVTLNQIRNYSTEEGMNTRKKDMNRDRVLARKGVK